MEHCKTYGNEIKLVENEKTIDDDAKVAEELNNFFKIAVAPLDIHRNPYTAENVEIMSDPVENWQTLHLFIRKKNPQAKENYRPVNFLPLLSKVFERLM